MKCPYKRKTSRIIVETEDDTASIDFVTECFDGCDAEDCMAWENGRCVLIQKGKSEGGN